MTIKGPVAAIVPARGGSKSIPRKNLANLGGQPLITFVLKAALKCPEINRTICSTEDGEIAELCLSYGSEVSDRPVHLATDDAKVSDVLEELISEWRREKVPVPEILVLMQPTSPFVTQQHLSDCISLLRSDSELNSVQTVSRIPHNQHAFNQRTVAGGRVSFRFPEERRIGYNKQTKPALFQFGNIVAVRTTALEQGGGVFVEPSGSIEVDRQYAFDLDGPEDLAWGEYCLRSKLVAL
jgi:CMP-N,N'-diacetyllegionaminic acid synthase